MPAVVIEGPLVALDVEHGGPGSISGVVTQQGQPARKQVVLIAWPSLRALSSQVSEASGAYGFQRLRVREYLVVGVDEARALDPEAKLVVAT